MDTLGDEGEGALEKGTYDFEVIDARGIESNLKMLFADLQVLTGPDRGLVTSVSLYLPEDHERGAVFHFKKKVRGFADRIRSVGDVADDEYAAAVAEAIIGAKFQGEVDVQRGGDYDGRQELISTRPLEGVIPHAVGAPPATPTEADAAQAAGTPVVETLPEEPPAVPTAQPATVAAADDDDGEPPF